MTDDPHSADWSLKRLLQEVLGAGPKSAEDMTRRQASAAASQVLDPETDPLTLGAFLLANRWKGNTPTELAAFLDEMRNESVVVARSDCDPVDCGANYDGKRRTALLGVGAGLVAAAAGAPVVIHSGDRIPTGHGATYKHVLDALDVPTELPPQQSAAMVDETGFGFYYQPAFNPRVHRLLDRRERMGVRTVINTIETLANPADASVHLGSFYHLSFATRVIDTLVEATRVDFDRILMIQGLEGYDDVRPGYTKLADWNAGDLEDTAIETAEFGLSVEANDLAVDDVAVESAQLTEAVLTDDRGDGFVDAIALNAALRLYAHGTVDSIADGLELARTTMANGTPLGVLEALRAFDPVESAVPG